MDPTVEILSCNTSTKCGNDSLDFKGDLNKISDINASQIDKIITSIKQESYNHDEELTSPNIIFVRNLKSEANSFLYDTRRECEEESDENESHKDANDEPIKCTLCEFECTEKFEWTMHYLQNHTGKQPKNFSHINLFSCAICDYSTEQKIYLNRHVKIHSEEKNFFCNSCEFRSKTKSYLIVHMRTHTGEKPFACEFCDYRATLKNSLKTHIRTHSGEKPYFCDICDYRTAKNGNLLVHKRIHSGEKPFKCNCCDFKSKYKSGLNNHMKIHSDEKPYVCTICNYRTTRNNNLKVHMKKHGDEKPFQCNLCEYKTAHRHSLTLHIRRAHSDEKPYMCTVCNFRAKKRETVKAHLKLHTGEKSEKPFSCYVCNFRTISVNNLKTHMKLHVTNKRFECDLCKYTTTRKWHLMRHMKVHSAIQKPSQCTSDEESCDFNSIEEPQITIHTDEKPFNLENDLRCVKVDSEHVGKGESSMLHQVYIKQEKDEINVQFLPESSSDVGTSEKNCLLKM